MASQPPKALLIAFIRERELGLLTRAGQDLRQQFPGVQIIGLAPASLRSLVSGLPVEGWIWQRGGIIGDLRRGRFEYACLVYSAPGPFGHLKLEALALLAGARRVLGWRGGKLRGVGKLGLALSVLAKAGLVLSLAGFGAIASLCAALILSAARR